MAVLEDDNFALGLGAPNLRNQSIASDGTIYYGALGTGPVGLSDFLNFGGHLVRINAGSTDFDESFELNLDGEGLLFGINYLNNTIYSFQSDQPLQLDFSNRYKLYETNVTTLENQAIASWPDISGFIGTGPIVFEDKIYGFVSEQESIACYQYDPSTGATIKVFDVIGGNPTELFILE